jgi:flagellar biosynthesis GTPase FlhF
MTNLSKIDIRKTTIFETAVDLRIMKIRKKQSIISRDVFDFVIDGTDLTTRGYCENCDIEYKKEYYQKNKETLNQKTKEYQQKNKDKTREHSRKSSKKYYEKNKNKNKIKEYRKEYIEKNKDKIKEYHKEYMKEYEEKNKDKRREHQRKYYLKKKLEKEKANKIDPKAINAFMEELIKIKE